MELCSSPHIGYKLDSCHELNQENDDIDGKIRAKFGIQLRQLHQKRHHVGLHLIHENTKANPNGIIYNIRKESKGYAHRTRFLCYYPVPNGHLELKSGGYICSSNYHLFYRYRP